MTQPDRDASGPHPDESAVELHAAGRAARADIVLLCDHASNARPTRLGDLGLPPEDLARHIAYDVGARSLTLALADRLDAPAALSTFSRLVIDPNRGEDDPTLIMRLYDRSIVPGNRRVDAEERARRLETLYRPYHRAVAALLDAAAAGRVGATAAAPSALDPVGAGPLVVSVHSFTDRLRGRPPRPWHVGVLWRDDPATAARLLDMLRAEPDLCVGDNEPYAGALDGDTITRHAVARAWPHVVLEMRNDLIATEADGRRWADRLAPQLAELARARAWRRGAAVEGGGIEAAGTAAGGA